MSRTAESAPSSLHSVSRRGALRTLAGAAALGAAWPLGQSALAAELKGRIHQSVCLWCYRGYMGKANMDLDTFAAACAKLGLQSIELTSPGQWPTLKKHGLICAMTPSHGIGKGLNRLENHDRCLAAIRNSIDATADAGFPNAITFSGNRGGMDDEEGLKNCIAGLKKIAGYAEKKKVTVCLEYLNSINHKDYMADTTDWCVKLVHGVGSPRVKVLYDIYHAGMMKEDPLADIQKHHDCWGHYHTGGVPGRNEIDDTQEINYPAVMRAILATGYKGIVSQEFIPTWKDPLAALRYCVRVCDV